MIEIVSFSERQPLTLQVFAAPCMMTKQMNTDKKRTGMADSLMDDISLFIEENTEAEIIDEGREIR